VIPVASQPNGQGAPLAAQNGSAGGVGGPSASAPGGSPKRIQRNRPPNTFAGMQQAGMARPSPALAQQQANAKNATIQHFSNRPHTFDDVITHGMCNIRTDRHWLPQVRGNF
jgi:hypothetical protein